MKEIIKMAVVALESIAIFIGVFEMYINVVEIIERSHGKMTVFSQLSYLGDGDAIIYCQFWTLVFMVMLFSLVYCLIHRKKRLAVILSILILAMFFISAAVDTHFYNAPI